MHLSPFYDKMTAMKKKALTICFLALLMLLSACSLGKPKPTPDPHAGQVYLYDGYDWVWYTPIEGVEVNAFSKSDFAYIDGEPVFLGTGYTLRKGIDVSEHQKEINWDAVGTMHYDFCYVRIGRRGYTEGGLFEDTFFRRNYEGASTANVDVATRTDCAVAFCETIRRAGYEACVYYNRTTGYYRYDLSRLTAYPVWFALPCSPPDIIHPSFYYHIDMWQYSLTGQVPGISLETDLDYIFVPVAEEAEEVG